MVDFGSPETHEGSFQTQGKQILEGTNNMASELQRGDRLPTNSPEDGETRNNNRYRHSSCRMNRKHPTYFSKQVTEALQKKNKKIHVI